MATSRAPCQSCSLPFYTDENDRCPYCGQVAPDGGVAAAPSARSRATCDTCGLAYYDDESDACPYCAAVDGRAGSAETGGDDVEPEAEPAAGGDGAEAADAASGNESADESGDASGGQQSSSLLGTVLRPLRKLFGG